MTGYQSKKAAALDEDGMYLVHHTKRKDDDDDDTQVYGDALTIAYQSGYYDGKKAAQPAQEPVAWRYRTGTFWNRDVHWRYLETLDGTEGLQGIEPFYTTPPQKNT